MTARLDWLPVCFTGTSPETRVCFSPDPLRFALKAEWIHTQCHDTNISPGKKMFNVSDCDGFSYFVAQSLAA